MIESALEHLEPEPGAGAPAVLLVVACGNLRAPRRADRAASILDAAITMAVERGTSGGCRRCIPRSELAGPDREGIAAASARACPRATQPRLERRILAGPPPSPLATLPPTRWRERFPNADPHGLSTEEKPMISAAPSAFLSSPSPSPWPCGMVPFRRNPTRPRARR